MLAQHRLTGIPSQQFPFAVEHWIQLANRRNLIFLFPPFIFYLARSVLPMQLSTAVGSRNKAGREKLQRSNRVERLESDGYQKKRAKSV